MAVKKLTMPMPWLFWPLPADCELSDCELSRRARVAAVEIMAWAHDWPPPNDVVSMAGGEKQGAPPSGQR